MNKGRLSQKACRIPASLVLAVRRGGMARPEAGSFAGKDQRRLFGKACPYSLYKYPIKNGDLDISRSPHRVISFFQRLYRRS